MASAYRIRLHHAYMKYTLWPVTWHRSDQHLIYTFEHRNSSLHKFATFREANINSLEDFARNSPLSQDGRTCLDRCFHSQCQCSCRVSLRCSRCPQAHWADIVRSVFNYKGQVCVQWMTELFDVQRAKTRQHTLYRLLQHVWVWGASARVGKALRTKNSVDNKKNCSCPLGTEWISLPLLMHTRLATTLTLVMHSEAQVERAGSFGRKNDWAKECMESWWTLYFLYLVFLHLHLRELDQLYYQLYYRNIILY